MKSAQSCKPATSTKCAGIEYQECSEAPEENCVERDVSEPRQVSGWIFPLAIKAYGTHRKGMRVRPYHKSFFSYLGEAAQTEVYPD